MVLTRTIKEVKVLCFNEREGCPGGGKGILVKENQTFSLTTNMILQVVLCLNDQGGEIMNVSDKPSTLRAQMKHHEPIVCYPINTMDETNIDECAGFIGRQGSAAGFIAYEAEVAPTLRSEITTDVVYRKR